MKFGITDEAKAQIAEIARREGMTVDEVLQRVFAQLLRAPEVLETLPSEGSC